jgi:YD repeat-containing protein
VRRSADQLCRSWRGTATGGGCDREPWYPSVAPTYDHDGAGNLTAAGTGFQASYNAAGQTTTMSSLTGTHPTGATHVAPGQQERLDTTTAGVTETYRTAILGVTATTTPAGTVRYLRDPAGNVHAQRSPGGDWEFLLTDRLGSTTGVVTTATSIRTRYHYGP